MSGEHLTSKQNPSGELFKPVACTTPLNPCTFCGWPAELYQRTNAEGTYSQKAVMCSNFGGDDPTGDACPLHLPPEDFYHATKREAVEYWNERTARGIEKAKVLLEARRPSEANGCEHCGDNPEGLGDGEPCPSCHGQGCEPHECDDGRLVQGPDCQRCGGSGKRPHEPSEDARDAARYRYLRDLAGNGIMRLLMKPSNPDQWDALIDHDLAQQPQTKDGAP